MCGEGIFDATRLPGNETQRDPEGLLDSFESE